MLHFKFKSKTEKFGFFSKQSIIRVIDIKKIKIVDQ